MPAAKPMKVSSRDVAEAAGVSRTTVSFVLNEHPNAAAIPEDTRRRVLAVAASLGYTPSPEARALRAGRSDVVLCLMPHWPITGPFGVFLQELSSELYRVGLTMLIHQRSPGEDLGQVFGTLTPTAVVAIGELSVNDIELAQRRNITVTPFMGSGPNFQDRSALKQSEIGGLQAQYLISRGHRSLAYVLPSDDALDWFAVPRLQGAKMVAGAVEADLITVRLDPPAAASTRDRLMQLAQDGVTGICAYNDEVALALMLAAADQGIAIPGAVSLVGVDDSPLSLYATPHLTTIGFDFKSEARRLVRILTEENSDPQPPAASSLMTLHERQTVAGPNVV